MIAIEEAKARLRDLERSWAEVDEETMKANRADIVAVLDALDAAERERDDAIREMHARELHHFEEEQKSAELAAVIEKAIAYVRASWLGNGEPTRDTPAGEIIAILAAVPTDALRAVKAEVWDEGQQAEAEAQFQDAGYGKRPAPGQSVPHREGGADRWTVN